jgi:hypothetical protein
MKDKNFMNFLRRATMADKNTEESINRLENDKKKLPNSESGAPTIEPPKPDSIKKNRRERAAERNPNFISNTKTAGEKANSSEQSDKFELAMALYNSAQAAGLNLGEGAVRYVEKTELGEGLGKTADAIGKMKDAFKQSIKKKLGAFKESVDQNTDKFNKDLNLEIFKFAQSLKKAFGYEPLPSNKSTQDIGLKSPPNTKTPGSMMEYAAHEGSTVANVILAEEGKMRRTITNSDDKNAEEMKEAKLPQKP